MNSRQLIQSRMDYIEKGLAIGKPREYNGKIRKLEEKKKTILIEKRRKKEKEMDEWFESLNDSQKADVAYNFWDCASYEDKKEEYECE